MTSDKKNENKHDAKYYATCMVGGILSCGLTHTLVTPLDVTKCRMQTDPKLYTGLISGVKTIYANEGFFGLFRGWQPTLLGYSLQGLGKFGLYEGFKDLYGMARQEKPDKPDTVQKAIWLAASASAEVFADVLLCPWEMVKVKVQTAPRSENWSNNLFTSTRRMYLNKEQTKFPFGSLTALWSRQVPYTMAKFFFFEYIQQMFYDYIIKDCKENQSRPVRLSVTFASGYLAGIICAIVSHPADNLISQKGKEANKGKAVGQIVKEMGYFNLFTRGLGTRIIMIGTLTGLQWWIYDSFKTAVGIDDKSKNEKPQAQSTGSDTTSGGTGGQNSGTSCTSKN